MSHPAAAFPFAYRLPTDATLQARGTDPAGVTPGSARSLLIVLVLMVLALAGGLAALPPSGEAHSMVKQECLYDLEAGSNSTNDPLLCF